MKTWTRFVCAIALASLFLAQGTTAPKGYTYVGSYKALPAGPGAAVQITIDVYRKQ